MLRDWRDVTPSTRADPATARRERSGRIPATYLPSDRHACVCQLGATRWSVASTLGPARMALPPCAGRRASDRVAQLSPTNSTQQARALTRVPASCRRAAKSTTAPPSATSSSPKPASASRSRSTESTGRGRDERGQRDPVAIVRRPRHGGRRRSLRLHDPRDLRRGGLRLRALRRRLRDGRRALDDRRRRHDRRLPDDDGHRRLDRLRLRRLPAERAADPVRVLRRRKRRGRGKATTRAPVGAHNRRSDDPTPQSAISVRPSCDSSSKLLLLSRHVNAT